MKINNKIYPNLTLRVLKFKNQLNIIKGKFKIYAFRMKIFNLPIKYLIYQAYTILSNIKIITNSIKKGSR
jgi:hypothetical protein